MQNRLQKFLFLLLAVVLAAAPLPSTWAMTDVPAAAIESHCAQLDMQPAGNGNNDTQNCETGCSGSCCDASCNSCVPAASSISGTLAQPPAISTASHDRLARIKFTGRTVIPLLRPPATL
jgi:hypothetical protein